MLAILATLAGTPAASAETGRVVTVSSSGATQQEVHASYYDEFVTSVEPARNYTGSVENCEAGSISPAYAQDQVDRLNWYRWLAGVDADVTLDHSLDQAVQEAALVHAAGADWAHVLPEDAACWTQRAADASRSSNLARAAGGLAVEQYIEDWGPDNGSVGHRRFVLREELDFVGVGEAPHPDEDKVTNVIDVAKGFWGRPELAPEAVLWPPAGPVPSTMMYRRWSISVGGADFSNAVVSVRRDGQPITTSIEYLDSPAVGLDPILVFAVDQTDLPIKGESSSYDVAISGVQTPNGLTTFVWTTDAFDADAQPATPRPVTAEPEQQPAPEPKAGSTSVVDATYEDLLNRLPNDAERDSWDAASGVGRSNLVQELALSDAWVGSVVDDLYLATLGRYPDPAGRQYWIEQIRNDMPIREVAARFFSSPEYVGSMTTEAWVEDLYTEILGRTPDAGGLEYWSDQVRTTSEGDVAVRLYQAPESRRRRVADLYEKLLDRGPDSSGHAYWAEQLMEQDDIALAVELVSSDEYVALNS